MEAVVHDSFDVRGRVAIDYGNIRFESEQSGCPSRNAAPMGSSILANCFRRSACPNVTVEGLIH